MKKKFIDYYMTISKEAAKLSYAKRLQVGCVLVKNDSIISYGYNGMPAGWENDCEYKEYMDTDAGGWISPAEVKIQWPFEESIDGETTRRYKLKTKPQVLHSESNCLAKVAKSTESSEGATLFCTHAPCIECAKLIYQAGIKTVYFCDYYRDSTGLEFLKQGNVDVHQYNNSI